ncbi:branched-chain amino acid ABC transporter permease [Candidatus Uhrbacteria bacterium]|nr:branched-chain amino acid ABC transporter permease [Candidatus Uhrbacteria bacterium]
MGATAQLLVNTIVPGALFGLAAASFTLTHRVTKVLNLAHGGVVMVGAYSYFWASRAGWGAGGGAALALIAATATALLVALLVYEPLRQRAALSSIGNLIASFAALLVIEALLLMGFGSRTRSAPPLVVDHRYDILGGSITTHQLVIVVIAAVCVTALAVFLRRARLGVAMRAVADHEDVAAVVGIAPARVRLWAHAIAGFLAGITGVLLAGELAFEPRFSVAVAISAFTRSIIGGIGSIPGAFAGSLLTDLAMNLWTWVGPIAFREVAALLLVILVLLFRPWGLFGRRST